MQVKLGACRVKDDVKLAAKAGADAIVIDSMLAGTGASSEILLDHSGIPRSRPLCWPGRRCER